MIGMGWVNEKPEKIKLGEGLCMFEGEVLALTQNEMEAFDSFQEEECHGLNYSLRGSHSGCMLKTDGGSHKAYR